MFVEKLALRPEELGPADLDAFRAAGVDDQGIRDAALVCVLFTIIVRQADSLEFHVPESFQSSVKNLTSKRGYSMPAPLLWFPRT